jgi:hypothetical protein
MSVTNVIENSRLTIPPKLRVVTHPDVKLHGQDDSTRVNTPLSILQSALTFLSKGRVPEAVALFDEHFKFDDCALALEFTDKASLTRFFQKARELFPDTRLEASLFESGDYAFAEWELTATQSVPYAWITRHIPINVHGATVVRVEHGKILQWSDYYDQASSRRTALASFFTEWIDY